MGKNIIGISPSDVNGVAIGTASYSFDSGLFQKQGTYSLDSDNSGNYTESETLLSINDPKLSLILKLGDLCVVPETISRGTYLTVEISTNLNKTMDNVTLKVKDPSGNFLSIDGNGNDLTEVNVSCLEANGFDTTGFDLGTYEIWLETVSKKKFMPPIGIGIQKMDPFQFFQIINLGPIRYMPCIR